jgi:hypothetical protein
MIEIKIDGYLTETKLGNVLNSISEFETIKSYKVLNTRFRYDYFIKNKNLIIEFDGDLHYRDSFVIKRDNTKDELMKNLNIKVIRIPYFVQLNNETFNFYFKDYCNESFNIIQNYPCGWKDSKIFPASFCELGTLRFIKEFNLLPLDVQSQIKNSLIHWSEIYGEYYIINSIIKEELKM